MPMIQSYRDYSLQSHIRHLKFQMRIQPPVKMTSFNKECPQIKWKLIHGVNLNKI